MTNATTRPRALLSVSDKTGLVPFARALAERGYELVSTGGTASALSAAALPVVAVSDVTGFPEMMDGRVKTLHPRIHGGILARRARRDDMDALRAHGIAPVDIVAVNLYPFAKAAADPATRFEQLIEEIDIGGPSLVRAAAKNFQDVLVVVSPDDYARVIAELDRPGGPELEFRFALARKAFHHTGEYDNRIHETLHEFDRAGGDWMRAPKPSGEGTPLYVVLQLEKMRDLRYGENPHQPAALYELPVSAWQPWRILQGKELSYTNILDLDAAGRITLEFDEPVAAVIKHTNPCGVAIGASASEAYVRAREADSLSAFGGIAGLNRAIDVDTARALVSTFIEAVIAPSIDEGALEILATKKNMRVVTADLAWSRAAGAGPHATLDREELRSTLAGVLVQARDEVIEGRAPWPRDDSTVVTRRAPTPDEWAALRFAWRLCAHVKSNAVVFTDATRTLAIGSGQVSRVDAVKLAVMKAADRSVVLRGSVAASDAFFPFRDGLDAIAAAGATAIVQPGGSVRDQEVIAAADEHGMAMVFTGRRHFRH